MAILKRDPNHDISWHNVDEEFNKFAIEQLKETETCSSFAKARIYQLMESYWPKAAEAAFDLKGQPRDRPL